MLVYKLTMRVPAERYVPPELIAERYPFLTVEQAPSEYEVALARGSFEPFMKDQSILPSQLLHLIAQNNGVITTREDVEFQFSYTSTGNTWRVFAPKLMHEPEHLTLTEAIAVLDYCGGF